MKISSNKFYSNHLSEITRFYSDSDDVLHILNKSSNFPDDNLFTRTIFIDPEIKEDIINFSNDDRYDLVVVTDLFELSDDIYKFFNQLSTFTKPNGKVMITSINPKWNRLLSFFEYFKLKNRTSKRNYIHPKKIDNIAKSTGFELIYNHTRQLIPFKFFGIGSIINKVMEFIFMYFNFGIKTYSLFRLENYSKEVYTKSIIIPAKNEEGNLEELIERIPAFENYYEIIIICGDSEDNTYEKSIEISKNHGEKNISVFMQESRGKAGAVYEAIEHCTGDLITILDADISVDPETLSSFNEIIENGYADFVNGTRLIYGKEQNAMRFLNNLGNLFFQFIISLVIKQKLTDSLCGTKVFKKKNIEHIYKWQDKNLAKDPFGDFDLIFSSAYSGQKILEYPVHYRSRKYGKTQISRFRDGWKLLFYFISSFFYFNVSK